MADPSSQADGPSLAFLSRATRLAVRGHGGAAPNPLVGCVIVAADGRIVGEGFHRRCGGPHAEVVALGRAGAAARGATAYVTLEPCDHTGRTGPCSRALIDAGIARVVIARRDPSDGARGGAERLGAAGVDVRFVACPAAERLAGPFIRRATLGLPWVTLKWAQTIDGRIATRSGESRWISGERSRRLVHRERGRVDALLTGIGTVLADDPTLTARGVRRRRIARRVVVDPRLELPASSRLLASLEDAPLTVACVENAAAQRPERAASLERAGVELIALTDRAGELPLEDLLRELVRRHETTHVLVEAGAGLVSRLLRDGLACELAVFVAPMIIGDAAAIPAVAGIDPPSLADARRFRLRSVHRRGEDVLVRYWGSGVGG